MSFGSRIYAELRGDRAIWTIVILLGIISLLAVYSSTGTIAFKNGLGTQYYLQKHFLLLGTGLVITYFCYLMHYMKYSVAAPYMILLAVPMLVFTLAMGSSINEARRWISIPVLDITFQTSEFAKIALVTFVARTISSKQDYIKDFQSAFLPIIVPILVICGLIAPADLSTAALLFFVCVLLMFMGRVSVKYIWLLIFCGVVLFSVLVMLGEFFPDYIRVATWKIRIDEFFNNEEGVYQVQQAKIAIASGEFFGLGPGNSIARNFLPAAYSDFIYAIICEEYGLLGGFAIIFLYVMLFVRCVRLVVRSQKSFGALLALGMGLLIVTQALANMAVSVHLVPVTGLTLPLMSMGGTSMLFTSVAAGMILSVSRYIEKI
jgi:cell division protein FtsW